MKRLLLYAAIAFSVFSLTYNSKDKKNDKELNTTQVVGGTTNSKVEVSVEAAVGMP